MRKSFADPEFSAEYKKLMGDDASLVSGEELELAIRDLPRDPDVIQLYNKMTGPDRLPSRCTEEQSTWIKSSIMTFINFNPRNVKSKDANLFVSQADEIF